MDEATNIQYFVDRIRPQTNLEIILAVTYNNESLKNDASSFVNFVESELVCTKMRRESHNYGNKRKMSKFQTRNSGGNAVVNSIEGTTTIKIIRDNGCLTNQEYN